MASRKSPGMAPLGHPPLSKVKLEGPKKHHDDHGPNASVPAKGEARAIPGEHWEKLYNPCPYKDTNKVKGSDFNPKRSNERVVTYNKVNQEDH